MSPTVPAGAQATVQAGAQAQESKQCLTFMLSGELFAIGILCIKEIIGYGGLTEVPMMPACIRGVINLRGAVVPVLDLALRFGKPSNRVSKKTCIVIVEIKADEECHDIGVVVDAVNAVREIPLGEIEPPPAFGAKIRTDFIEGMGKVNGHFVILLNANAVLSLDEISLLGRASRSAESAAASA